MAFLSSLVQGFFSVANLVSELAETAGQTITSHSVRAGLATRLRQKGVGAEAAKAAGLAATGRGRWLCPWCGSIARFRPGARYWLLLPVWFIWLFTATGVVVAGGVILGGEAPTVVAILVGLAGLLLLAALLAAFIEVLSREYLSERPRIACRQCGRRSPPRVCLGRPAQSAVAGRISPEP